MIFDPNSATFNFNSLLERNVLILCSANRCRSILAEAFLKHYSVHKNLHLNVESAGTDALSGLPPTEETCWILKQRQLSCPKNESSLVTADQIRRAQIILVMEDYHEKALNRFAEPWIYQSKTFKLGTFYPGDDLSLLDTREIPDPLGVGMHFHEIVTEIIENSILAFIVHLELILNEPLIS
jgi:protein-tyrosine-phosphatase